MTFVSLMSSNTLILTCLFFLLTICRLKVDWLDESTVEPFYSTARSRPEAVMRRGHLSDHARKSMFVSYQVVTYDIQIVSLHHPPPPSKSLRDQFVVYWRRESIESGILRDLRSIESTIQYLIRIIYLWRFSIRLL